nr:MAG TPA: hypothetical protein [Caudoviricetes sp.]
MVTISLTVETTLGVLKRSLITLIILFIASNNKKIP